MKYVVTTVELGKARRGPFACVCLFCYTIAIKMFKMLFHVIMGVIPTLAVTTYNAVCCIITLSVYCTVLAMTLSSREVLSYIQSDTG